MFIKARKILPFFKMGVEILNLFKNIFRIFQEPGS